MNWWAELRSEEARSPSKASADWSSKSLIFAVDWCRQPVCNTCDGSHLLNLVEVRGVMFFWSPFMELAFTVWALHADLKVIVFAWFLLCCRVSKSRNFCELNVGNMLQPATAFSCNGRWAYSMFLRRHCTEWSRFCTKLTKADNIRRPCLFRQAKKKQCSEGMVKVLFYGRWPVNHIRDTGSMNGGCMPIGYWIIPDRSGISIILMTPREFHRELRS